MPCPVPEEGPQPSICWRWKRLATLADRRAFFRAMRPFSRLYHPRFVNFNEILITGIQPLSSQTLFAKANVDTPPRRIRAGAFFSVLRELAGKASGGFFRSVIPDAVRHAGAASLIRDLIAVVARGPGSAPHRCVPRRRHGMTGHTARRLNRLVLRQAQDEVLMLSLSKHEATQMYGFICRAVSNVVAAGRRPDGNGARTCFWPRPAQKTWRGRSWTGPAQGGREASIGGVSVIGRRPGPGGRTDPGDAVRLTKGWRRLALQQVIAFR